MAKQSDALNAKKLRTDHPFLTSGISGETLANLEQIMPEGSHLLAREQPVAPSVVPPSEPVKKSKKLLEQERLSLEEAIRLQEQVDEEERAQVARDEEIARQPLAVDEERVTTEPKITKDNDWNDPSVQKLVKERYSSSKPEGYDLMLWGDLHTLFEPDERLKFDESE
ncbi:hypothetical protein Tco_1523248 [Tanacetum coccineum]